MVPEDALRSPCIDEPPNDFDDRRAIGSAVNEVPNEDQPTALRVRDVDSMTEAVEEILERIDLPMHIAHDVDGALKKRLDQIAQ